MKKILIPLILLTTPAHSSELIFQFNSPAFNGNGYSTHVLTIEQLEDNRKKQIKDELQADIDKADRDLKSTNAYKFQNNLESRIYAQMSKQISDRLFGETGDTLLDGNWYEAETPFGDIVSWKREMDRIYVKVQDSNGDTISEFDVPVGEFAF